MREDSICQSRRSGLADPVYRYILTAAGILFLHLSLGRYALALYEHCLIIPCLMFLGAIRERGTDLKFRKRFILPLAMAGWFLILQIRRSISYDEGYNVGLFLSIYLFAFPLATILNDGDNGKALKIFAGAYLAAATVLAAEGLLLVFDCLPSFLSKDVCWDGARLKMVWHPNIAGCFLMIGIVFGTVFLSQANSRRIKIGLGAVIALLLGAIALTNCRTAILLTGAYLGTVLFFAAVKRGWKWFLPGVLAVLVVTVVFYLGTGQLYQANHDMLVEKYTQQYAQLMADSPDDSVLETLPFRISSRTGEVRLKTDSPQGSIEKDLGTLNSRTQIWNAAILALRESRAILLWGIGNPGWYVSHYNAFEIVHLHNAWMECLVGLGLAGFLMAVLFTLMTLWNCLVVLLKHHQDIWKRSVALLVLCLMAAAFLEPYLFYTAGEYHMVDFLFFLCSGYLVHWQAEDNRRILAAVRSRLPILKR